MEYYCFVDENNTYKDGDYYFRGVTVSEDWQVTYNGYGIETCIAIVDACRLHGNTSSSCEECIDLFESCVTIYNKL